MLFNTPIFVFVYLPVVWLVYLLAVRLPWSQAGIAWLAVASLFFYGYWNPAFVPLLLMSIAFNYAIGRLLATRGDGEVGATRDAPAGGGARQAILIAGIAVDLGLLAYYKYANFLAGSVAAVTGTPAPVFDIVLPLASRSIRSRRSPTSSTPIVRVGPNARRSPTCCSSRSSRTWSPARCCITPR